MTNEKTVDPSVACPPRRTTNSKTSADDPALRRKRETADFADTRGWASSSRSYLSARIRDIRGSLLIYKSSRRAKNSTVSSTDCSDLRRFEDSLMQIQSAKTARSVDH